MLPELRPESANQHGRLYPATKTDAALVVSTDMSVRAMAIPADSTALVKACLLTSQDVATARQLGVTGF